MDEVWRVALPFLVGFWIGFGAGTALWVLLWLDEM